MADQKTIVEHQIRPDELMAELGIKKDAYYAYLKHLGVKANKDRKGKAYLAPEDANLIRELRVHVEKTGKIETFQRANSEGKAEPTADGDGGSLANAEELGLEGAQRTAMQQMIEAVADDQADEIDIRSLIYGAGELKAQEMMLPQLLQQQLADQMTFEDLPEELQVQVRQVQERSRPKFDPASAAAMVLGKWRTIQAKQRAEAR